MLNTQEEMAIREFFDVRNEAPLRSALTKFIQSLRDEHTEGALKQAINPQMAYKAGQHAAIVVHLDDFLPSFAKWEGK